MAIITKRTLVRIKEETGYGNDASPALANTVKACDVSLALNAESLKQPILTDSLSQWKEVMGARWYELTFRHPIHGAGSAVEPRIAEAIRSCGMSVSSLTYTPSSSSFDSCSIYVYMDGLRFKLLGARGSMKCILDVGAIPMFEFSFKAKYAVPTDTAMPTDSTYETTHPVAFLNSSFTMDSYAGKISSLELDLANEVNPVIDSTQTTDVSSIEVVGREPSGTYNPIAELEATEAYWGNFLTTEKEMALSVVLNGGANNTITITAPKCKYRSIGIGDRDGVRAYDINFALGRNAGDDELSIAQT